MAGMDRYKRGRALYSASWELVRGNRRLLVWPIVFAVTAFAVNTAAFLVSANVIGAGYERERLIILLATVIVGYPMAFLAIFCGVALAGTLTELLEGREPDWRVGWRLARSRVGVIAAWALLVATIGGLLKVLEDRLPLGGKIIAWLADLGWSVATLFAVPVLAYEGLGPIATLKRSASVVRERFGTAVGGLVATAALSWVAGIPGVIMLFAGLAAGGAGGVLVAALGFGWLLVVASWAVSMDYVFRVVLYRDVTGHGDGARVGGVPALLGALDLAFPERPTPPRGTTWTEKHLPGFSKHPDDYR